jgi:hypothetical protein
MGTRLFESSVQNREVCILSSNENCNWNGVDRSMSMELWSPCAFYIVPQQAQGLCIGLAAGCRFVPDWRVVRAKRPYWINEVLGGEGLRRQ